MQLLSIPPALRLAERAGVYVKGGYYVYTTTLPWFSRFQESKIV